MKFTLVKTDKNKQTKLSSKKPAKIIERIARTNSESAGTTRIYPSAEFIKDNGGKMKYAETNCLLLLNLKDNQGSIEIKSAKAAAAALPFTYMAIIGAEPHTLNVIIRIGRANGIAPWNERTANQLCQLTFPTAKAIYEQATGMTVYDCEPSIRNSFTMGIDENPYLNETAQPIDETTEVTPDRQEVIAPEPIKDTPTETQDIVPEQETETIEETVESPKQAVTRMINYLSSKYDIRWNTINHTTEYRDKGTESPYLIADERVKNRMIIEARLEDIDISATDLDTWLNSDLIERYDPVEQFVSECRGTGKRNDSARALAKTLPYFLEFFTLAKNKEEGVYMTSAEILEYLQSKLGDKINVNNTVAMGRILGNMSGMISRRIARGVEYLVVKLK